MPKFRYLIPALLAVTACTRSMSVSLPPQSLTVLVYAQGKVSQHCKIAPDSDKFRKLSELLRQNAAGWHKSLMHYDPLILVEGAEVSINVMDDSVVMNKGDGDYAHAIPAGSFAFLGCKAS